MLKAFDANMTRRAMLLARETLEIEADAIRAVHARLASDDSVGHAVGLLMACKGRVVVSGIGKSGHIARKIAATLASTGT
ncbi:MAG: KpsF/GutQ family sugar-phosphate isomerase, partial [Massilia sp.]